MRIAPNSGRQGRNNNGEKGNIRAIEKRVGKLRTWLTRRNG